MRRATRWAWNGLVAASLVLCVAALAAWPASWWRTSNAGVYFNSTTDHLERRWVGTSVGEGLGCLSFGWTKFPGADPTNPAKRLEFEHRSEPPASYPGPAEANGNRFAAADSEGDAIGISYHYAYAVAPLWAWVLLFALLPGWLAVGWYRRRRKHRVGPAFEVVTREGRGLAGQRVGT